MCFRLVFLKYDKRQEITHGYFFPISFYLLSHCFFHNDWRMVNSYRGFVIDVPTYFIYHLLTSIMCLFIFFLLFSRTMNYDLSACGFSVDGDIKLAK